MKKVFLSTVLSILFGPIAFGSELQEKSAFFLFADQHANPTVMKRYEKVARDILVNEGKDPSLLRVVMVDQIQKGHLECFPKYHVSPRLSLLNIISKSGEEVACYTEASKEWPSDKDMREIIRLQE